MTVLVFCEMPQFEKKCLLSDRLLANKKNAVPRIGTLGNHRKGASNGQGEDIPLAEDLQFLGDVAYLKRW
jgi:hypothetical protein